MRRIKRGRHPEKALSAAKVRSIEEPGFYADGHGLYLKVDPSGAKRWIQRIVIRGKRTDLGLGSASLVSLAEAREQALQNRRTARKGGDPLSERRDSEEVLTFEEAARKVHELHLPTWRNPKHGAQWLNTLTEYAFPLMGRKKMDAVTSADVLAVLSPIWTAKPETAARVRQRIGAVMKWGIAQGWRTDNPAADVTRALPKRDKSKIQHRAALPYSKVAGAIAKVKASGATESAKLALEFLILTATRSGEVRGAKWGEIDREAKVWTIPAERMKAKKPHRVPLSPRALALLDEAENLPSEAGFIFPGAVKGKPLSDVTLSKLLKELGIECVPHGFRSSFRVWAGEQTNLPREVCEFALAHVVRDKTEAAYQRSDLFEKRRKLMEAWAGYLAKMPTGEVVRLPQRKEGVR